MAIESARKRKRGVDIRVVHGPAVMSEADARVAEDLFAEIIAHTFACERHLFGPDLDLTENLTNAGAPAAAAEVGSAPLPNAGAPANMELELNHEHTEAGRSCAALARGRD